MNQDAKGLRFGSRAVKGPDMVRDLKAVVERKIPVYLVADDLAERGISASQTIPGIEHIARTESPGSSRDTTGS